MPIKVRLTFTKEVDATVIGETIEEVEAAARKLARSKEIDHDWSVDDWDVQAHPITPDKMMTTSVIEKIGCHLGVVNGKLLHIMDYNSAKGTNIPEAKD